MRAKLPLHRTALVVWLLTVTLGAMLLSPAVSRAEHFRGKRYVANPSGSRQMGISRAKSVTRRTIRRVFAVQRGTETYICSRHSSNESGCDFQFVSKFGNTTCGNTVVHAYRSRIVVRYDAYNAGCGDF